jgi:hypothetical protein
MVVLFTLLFMNPDLIKFGEKFNAGPKIIEVSEGQ